MKISPHHIIENYETFFIDVWGVLTDGLELNKSGTAFLEYLKKNKKKTVLFSNTSLLSENLAQKLANMGMKESLYDFIVTAGEVTRNLLISKKIDLKGLAYFYIGPEENKNLLNDTDYCMANRIEKADFIILTGYFEKGEETIKSLSQGLKKSILLICTDPDVSIRLNTGEFVLCAGYLAKQYELLGGPVLNIGKPYPAIYAYAYEKLNIISKKTILFIGDNLETDIAGAFRQNIDSLLLTETFKQSYKGSLITPQYAISSLDLLHNPL